MCDIISTKQLRPTKWPSSKVLHGPRLAEAQSISSRQVSLHSVWVPCRQFEPDITYARPLPMVHSMSSQINPQTSSLGFTLRARGRALCKPHILLVRLWKDSSVRAMCRLCLQAAFRILCTTVNLAFNGIHSKPDPWTAPEEVTSRCGSILPRIYCGWEMAVA